MSILRIAPLVGPTNATKAPTYAIPFIDLKTSPRAVLWC
ncbi:hypothetical protein ECML10_000144 [Escherichia phage ECML-10]|nr:hypothetical protein ECML10_000144 [Escherichia phage ECML-10]